MTQPLPFKLGRRPARPESEAPRLKLGQFLRPAALPPTPATIDWVSQVPDWPVYLNDQIGDCTFAAAGHMIEAWSQYGQGTTVKVSDSDVLTAYEAVSGYNPDNPSTDQGAVMQDVLNYWRKTGVGGHRILAFAELDVRNLPEVYAALHLFGHVYVGVEFPNSAFDQFDRRQPWTVTGDRSIAGGHAVNVGARNAGTMAAVTWGRVVTLDETWWLTYVEEAWVAVDQTWISNVGTSPEGLDVAALNAAFQELTGQPGPFPLQPAPEPPGPTPQYDPADLALSRAVTFWVNQRHYGEGRKVANALKAWRRVKGL